MVRRIYKSLRLVIVLALLLAVAVPAVLYVGLSLSPVHEYAGRRVSGELSRLLGAKVEIGSMSINPFNRATLRNVSVTDSAGDTIAVARRIGANFGLMDLLFRHRLVINSVEALGLDLRICRDSAGAPLNIAPIMARLSKPGGDGGVPDLRFNVIVLRGSRVSYDVLDAPVKPLGEFDANHIALVDLRADARLALMRERRAIGVDLSRMGVAERRSGMQITDFTARALLQKEAAPSGRIASVTLRDMSLAMPGSRLLFGPVGLVMSGDGPTTVELLAGSHVLLSDLAPLLPEQVRKPLSNLLDSRIDVRLVADATRSDVSVSDFSLAVARGAVTVNAPQGLYASGLDSLATASFSVPLMELTVNPAASALMPFAPVRGDTVATAVLPLTATIEGSGSFRSGGASVNFESRRAGNASFGIEYEMTPQHKLSRLEGNADVDNLAVAAIVDAVQKATGRHTGLAAKLPRSVTASVEGRALFVPGRPVPDGTLSASIASIELRRRDGSPALMTDIIADVTSDHGLFDATLESLNDGFALTAELRGDIEKKSAAFDLTLDDLDLSLKGGEHLSLTATGNAALQPAGAPLPATGHVEIRDILLSNPHTDAKGLSLKSVEITSAIPADTVAEPSIDIKSDIFTASLTGSLEPGTIMADVRGLVGSLFPDIADSMLPGALTGHISRNDLRLQARILNSAPVEEVVKLPVQVRYPVDISATLSSAERRASLRIDAPYLWQGNKEIDATSLCLLADGSSASLAASTRMPSKNGMMDLHINSELPADSLNPERRVSTVMTWDVDAARDFSGTMAFDVVPRHDPEAPGRLMADVDILPSRLTFNDTVWTATPAHITLRKGIIDVDGFRVGRTGQYVEIDGTITDSDRDVLTVSLADVDLDYVFETLNISNAMFGGVATGKLYASGLLGRNMVAYTPDLFVKGLKYNFSLMGDTHIKASYDPAAPAVNIDAKVDQPNGLNSYITGYIKPTSEGYIDLDFTADRIEVGFMKPFMSAFASAVHGYASGNAHLFGTFHDVNMSGDIFVEDLSLKLDFTGTTYWATDSVHLTPGYIDLNNITLRDRDGHQARLDGYLRHTNFHLPRFQFRITGADDLLVYDIPETPDQRWYGTIYGDGSVTITGVPGHIDIGVNMATAPNSTFTFVLSDAEEAYDYQFITFRDRNDKDGKEAAAAAAVIDGIPAEVVEMRNTLAKKTEEESASIYDMSISVSVNPDALLTVVMDPVGGDAIRARGYGDMTMTYNSASEDLGLRGDYTLDNGTYNFTFQDIIRKDFRINQGSTIRFNGDPYAAQLDIEAAYRLTANLSDLDESFLEDPELTRTSVPVDALINVTGDMRAPDISYDFGFPTLKDDIKRKVNSIVSTDDMRARQMLYLLALNRFYTPEYMTATKGNELFSVASSTLSSQISNMLGSLAENWTIAPNIRSDRGDFSDVEFDLALSSSLLNNRLLFNGNFGYRDKSLNNNTFIGDFDLEYLLNRSGSLRLKAYNRYNDQNFYVKNALTTQGVGIVFRRDFDDILGFLRRRRKPSSTTEAPADTVSSTVTDTAKPVE